MIDSQIQPSRRFLIPSQQYAPIPSCALLLARLRQRNAAKNIVMRAAAVLATPWRRPRGGELLEMNQQFAAQVVSEADFCAWLSQASPGEIVEYHRGFLMIDRLLRGNASPSEHQEIVRIADRALWAEEQRLIHLVQKRHRLLDYSYLAVARPRDGAITSALRAALDDLSHADQVDGA